MTTFIEGPSLASNPSWAFAANAEQVERKPLVDEDPLAGPSVNDVAADRQADFEKMWAKHEARDIDGTLINLGLPTLEQARLRDQAILDSGIQAVAGLVEYPADSQYL